MESGARMKSYDVVGYVLDSETYHAECITLTDEEEQEASAIFASSEYDYYPTCNECGLEIDDITLTSDGVKWLNDTGRKADWQSWSDIFPDDFKQFFDAYYGTDSNWHCLDCFCEHVLGGEARLIKQFREAPDQCSYLVDCISD